MNRRHLLLLAALTFVSSGCDQVKSMFGAGKVPFNSIDITGAGYAGNFTLTDQDGRQRTLNEFKGKLVAVFFGFTQCPDVCPTALAELAQIKRSLGPEGDKLQGIFITIDPERDTPEVLKAYVSNFDKSFVALRGTPEQTAAVAKEFKVFYAKSPGSTPDSYSMDHTAGMFVFDTQGRIRLFSRHGMGPQPLAADMRQLLQAG